MTPTQRALAHCRSLGYTAAVVEKWNPHAKVRQDLFGVIDVLALTPAGILALQVCAGASHSARRAKILAEPRAASWVKAGGLLELWSYSKRGARGRRKQWVLRVQTYQQMQEER